MEKTKFSVPSSDGIHTLAGVVYLPDTQARGYFHIVHGMTEHIGRYDKFMCDMAEMGYICFGYDNLGHGYTARDKSELGYIAKKGGYDLLCRDVKKFSDEVFKEYGRLPYFLMGHSMGSFIARLATEKYVHPDKLIIMGTGGKNAAAGAGLGVTALVKLFYGEKHISRLVDRLAFGGYTKRFPNEPPSAWLTKDRTVIERYRNDDFCSFKFTVSAMSDLIRLNKDSNRAAWYKNMPKDVPVLLVSGDCDPVGNYGKGVREVGDKLKRSGVDARCILYPDARHEIINDVTYDKVKSDILEFLSE